jgi:hypothetical protein
MDNFNRRSFLANVTLATGAVAATGASLLAQTTSGEHSSSPEWMPQQDPAVVKEVVGAAHANLARVRDLVERQPALSNATVDWGFGDWENALGAASHMGRRDIADLLLAHGARPTIFSAAMLGHLDVIKACVATSPGVQRTLGPHGITLLAHARAGGAGAAEVVKYLELVGDADRRPPTQPLAPAERDRLLGEYSFGPSARDRFVIDVRDDQLGIERPGQTRRMLFHKGNLVFFPSGVPSFHIAFASAGGHATQLTLANPDVFLTAKHIA